MLKKDLSMDFQEKLLATPNPLILFLGMNLKAMRIKNIKL